MKEIKNILVATDGSEYSLKAAAIAGDLARGLHGTVTVLIVQSEDIVVPHAWGLGAYPMTKPHAPMSVEEARDLLEKHVHEEELPATAAAIGELETAPELVHRWGHPASEICKYAAENDIDLIVIGSHGRSGLAGVILGSVSHAVVNNAHCPVTVVR